MNDMAREQSMEDILTSIRRVMARDDQRIARGGVPTPVSDAEMRGEASPSEDFEDDDVLDLGADGIADEPPLLSGASADAAREAFRSLERLPAEPTPAAVPIAGDHRVDLEALVMTALRPVLRDWLDANLPAIVEDLVAREIERTLRQRG